MSVDIYLVPSEVLSDVLSLQKAVEVMCIVPKRCNDMMNVGRLQGFDVRHSVLGQNEKLSYVD